MIKTNNIQESGKDLTAMGFDLQRITLPVLQAAEAKLGKILSTKGIEFTFKTGRAGSFSSTHPYNKPPDEKTPDEKTPTLAIDSGDIDIELDLDNLKKVFLSQDPNKKKEQIVQFVNWHSMNTTPKTIKWRPNLLDKYLADPKNQSELEKLTSRYLFAQWFNGDLKSPDNLKSKSPDDSGKQYLPPGFKLRPSDRMFFPFFLNGKNYAAEFFTEKPAFAWSYHTHDFSLDPGMRGADLWDKIYPTLAKISSTDKNFIDPKTREVKGNWQFSPNRGLIDRTTGKPLDTDKNEIAKKLLGPGATDRDLSSLSGISNYLYFNNKEKWDKVQDETGNKLPITDKIKQQQASPQTENIQFGSAQWMRKIIDKL